jgi:hypothetical protein
VAAAAQKLRNDENVWLGYRNDNPDAAAELVELPIGSAVRVRYLVPIFLAGNWAHVDYWFFARDRLLVLTYVDGRDYFPPSAGMPTSLETMVQSIQLID